jgi:uncharacterized protein (TIGR03083 family)
MGQRAESLADDFEQAIEELSLLIEGLSDAQWATRTESEGWTVAATARHIVWGYDFLGGRLDQLANGERPGDPGDIHALNAQNAEQFMHVPRDEILAQLRTTGAERNRRVRGYSDEQLEISFTVPSGQTMTVAQLIAGALVGHVRGHTGSIRQTLGL